MTSNLIKSYLSERSSLMKSRWLKVDSWWRRSREKTRYSEIEALLEIESSFRKKWEKVILNQLITHSNNLFFASELRLDIDIHSKKHKERGFFLVVFGALVAVVLKQLTPDWVLSLYLIFTAFLVAFERIFSSSITTSLEELSSIVALTEEKHKQLSQKY